MTTDSRYFAQKAIDAADALWDEGLIDENVAADAMKLAKKLAIHMTDVLKCDGFNLVQNNHEVAGQTVFHFHMHLIPRYLNAKNNDILNWSHETFSPEEMAEIRDSLKMES